MVADINVRIVNQGEIKVCINVFAEMNVFAAPVCPERRLFLAFVAELLKHFF